MRPFQICALSIADIDSRIARTPMRPGDRGDLGELGRHLGFAALDLDDQHRLDVERIAGMGEILADLDRGPVHVFHRHRHDAGADDRRDAAARVGAGIEAEQHRPRALGGADQPDGRLDDDAELPLRAADEAEPVEPGGVELGAADVEDVAVEGDEPDAEQVVDRHAVFEAMRAARVHADIAADRAGELRGRVGRVEEAVAPDTASEIARLVTPASTRA